MTTRKINGQLFRFPDGWHDVPFNVGRRILNGELEGVELFSALSGVDVKSIETSDAPEVIEKFLYGFPFLATLPTEDFPEIPISITIDGHNIYFPHVKDGEPFDFGKATVGQIEEMDNVIQKHYKKKDNDKGLSLVEQMEIMPLVVAMYVQPFVQGTEYDTKKANKLAKVIESQCSVKEVVNIAQFFFRKLYPSKDGLTNKCPRVLSLIKRLKRVFMRLTMFLGFTQR